MMAGLSVMMPCSVMLPNTMKELEMANDMGVRAISSYEIFFGAWVSCVRVWFADVV